MRLSIALPRLEDSDVLRFCTSIPAFSPKAFRVAHIFPTTGNLKIEKNVHKTQKHGEITIGQDNLDAYHTIKIAKLSLKHTVAGLKHMLLNSQHLQTLRNGDLKG